MSKCAECRQIKPIVYKRYGLKYCEECRPNKSASSIVSQQAGESSGAGDRWSTLRWISGLYVGLAWFTIFAAAVGILIGLIMLAHNPTLGILLIINCLVGGAGGAISCIFISQMILLWIAIEENTRGTLENLEVRRRKTKKPEA